MYACKSVSKQLNACAYACIHACLGMYRYVFKNAHVYVYVYVRLLWYWYEARNGRNQQKTGSYSWSKLRTMG